MSLDREDAYDGAVGEVTALEKIARAADLFVSIEEERRARQEAFKKEMAQVCAIADPADEAKPADEARPADEAKPADEAQTAPTP